MTRRVEDIREKIIEAAMRVFAQYGYFRAPISLIAREADVSKGLIFWYFRSKDELILEVASRSLPLDVINDCLKTDLEGLEFLNCLGGKYLDKYTNPMYRNLMLHTVSIEELYPSLKEKLREICEKHMVKIAERVYGKSGKAEIVKMRTFFGSLLCYTLRVPRNISRNEYLEILVKTVYGA